MPTFDQIALAQLSRRTNKFREAELHNVRPGWIRYMRLLLGLTLRNLGRLVGLSVASVAQAERKEADGAITIKALRRYANALDCDLVYGFVPRRPIHESLKRRARRKAAEILSRANTHMSLEDQQVRDEPLDARIQRLADQLLATGDIW